MLPNAKRNDAMRILSRIWTPEAKETVRSARKAVKREEGAAKATWVREAIGTTQPPDDGRLVTPKTVRNAIWLLTRGPGARR